MSGLVLLAWTGGLLAGAVLSLFGPAPVFTVVVLAIVFVGLLLVVAL